MTGRSASRRAAPTTIEQLLAAARAGLPRLSPAAAHAAMREGVHLVDIRSDNHRSVDGVIPGAHHIPRNVLEWRLDPACPHRDPLLARHDARVVLLCDEGYQSSLAAATVRRFGLAEVGDVVGGFRAWRDAGFPVWSNSPNEATMRHRVPFRTPPTRSLTSAAEAYDRHVGRYGGQLAAGLIGVAAVRPGHRALDVGCGPGSLTTVLANVLGAENVAAVDPSEPFVDACRARVPGADVQVGVAESLPFPAGSFDVVFAQLVVPLMGDRDAGVREMARVARPGGIIAACVWDSCTMPLLRSFWDAALDTAPEPAGAIDDGRRVGYDSPEELGGLFDACGLAAVTTGELLVGADYESFEELWRPFAAGVGHSGGCCASLDPDRQALLRSDVQRHLGSPEGAFRLTARVWWARGNVG